MVSAPPTLVAHISLLSAELVDCKLDYLPLFDVSCRHLLHVTSVTSCVLLAQADIVTLMRAHTKKRVAAIGDGGNDVSMIQVHLLCYHTSSCFNIYVLILMLNCRIHRKRTLVSALWARKANRLRWLLTSRYCSSHSSRACCYGTDGTHTSAVHGMQCLCRVVLCARWVVLFLNNHRCVLSHSGWLNSSFIVV